MRKVFGSADETAKVWAQRSQDEGSSKRFFFRKGIIHSYSWNWPVGIFFDGPDKKLFCLIEENRCSNSTAGHIGLARWAAEKAGASIIPAYGIERFKDLSEKPKIGVINKLRAALEEDARHYFEEVDKNKDGTQVQGTRLGKLATLLRAHEAISESFDLGWAKMGSVEAVEARSDMNHRTSRDTGDAKYKALEKERRARDKIREKERRNPLPEAAELLAWRRGERLEMHNQRPRQHWDHAVRIRIREGRMDTDVGLSMKASEFGRMLRWAVDTVVARRDVFLGKSIAIGSSHVRMGGGGTAQFGNSTIDLDEMLTAAEIGAPRLYAKVLAALPEEVREARVAAAEEAARQAAQQQAPAPAGP